MFINSNLGPTFPVSEILQVFWEEQLHPLFYPNLGVFFLDWIANVVALRSEDPKLIIRVINFELVQPTGRTKKK